MASMGCHGRLTTEATATGGRDRRLHIADMTQYSAVTGDVMASLASPSHDFCVKRYTGSVMH